MAKQWEKLTNQAKHYSYQIANELVKNHGYLGMEDLKAKRMIENKEKIWKSVRKSIQQVRWNTTQNIVARKVEETGGQLVKVNPAYTSQNVVFVMNQPRKRLNYPKEYMNAGIVGGN